MSRVRSSCGELHPPRGCTAGFVCKVPGPDTTVAEHLQLQVPLEIIVQYMNWPVAIPAINFYPEASMAPADQSTPDLQWIFSPQPVTGIPKLARLGCVLTHILFCRCREESSHNTNEGIVRSAIVNPFLFSPPLQSLTSITSSSHRRRTTTRLLRTCRLFN